MLTQTALRLACLAALAIGVAAQAQRDEYASRASEVFDELPAEHTPSSITAAGRVFLASLDDSQRKLVQHPLRGKERRQWTNLPVAEGAGGLRLGDCSDESLHAARRLLAELLSEQGYRKVVHVLLGDDVLWDQEGRRRGGLGVAETRVVVFGEPSRTEPWGFQIDGHHIGVNVAVHGEELTLSPSFIGAQPDVFVVGGRELRPMEGEVELAFELVRSLSQEQSEAAIQDGVRGTLVSGPGADGKTPALVGTPVSSFDREQIHVLERLLYCWVGDLPHDHARARMRELSADMAEMRFAWWGPTEDGSGVSYRIQGPSVLIEFSCQGPSRDPQGHLHSMYRDPTNEYGGQLDD